MEDQTVVKIITLLSIGLLFLLGFFILRSILVAVVFGLLLAYIFSPLYKLVLKGVKEKNIATGLVIFLIVLAIVIPLWFLTPLLIRQTFDTYTYLQKADFVHFLAGYPSLFNADLAQTMGSSIQSLIGKTFTSFLNHLSDLLVNLPDLLLQLAVFLFTFYFALRDSDKLRDYFKKLSPFSESTEKKMLGEFRGITNAIIYGHVLVGILQGLLVGVGLFIVGFPKALILTFVAIVASIIPVLGSWVVWLPVSIFMILSGQTSSGLFLFIYGFLFVSIIDNILKPLFISKNSNLNVALSVMGTIGGLYYFGIIGLVLGPLILAYILIIFDLYREGKLSELFKK